MPHSKKEKENNKIYKQGQKDSLQWLLENASGGNWRRVILQRLEVLNKDIKIWQN